MCANQPEKSFFRTPPEKPLTYIDHMRVMDIPVEMVRAFYFDVMNAEARKHFNKFDQAWRAAFGFPGLAYMEYHEVTGEFWIYIPHPRTPDNQRRPASIAWYKWKAFYRRWHLFAAPDLPKNLIP